VLKPRDLLTYGKYEELWQLCAGFIDLDIEQFMNIQKRLLLEQINLLNNSALGKRITRGIVLDSVEEFRKKVPLTTYADYCPDLLDRNESVLPVKPLQWIQTSGRSGEYPCKWVPVTEQFWNEAGKNFCAIAMFGTCKKRGQIVFKNGFKILHAIAQTPCLTGAVAYKLQDDALFSYLPTLEESENISFEDRISKGFGLALSKGIEGFFGLSGILVAIGEKFKQGSGGSKLSKMLADPPMALRLIKGKVKSKIARRPMLPKDVWSLKMIVAMGADCAVYKNKIEELWGRKPLEVYGNTETTVTATQTWDYQDMIFFPNLNFLEFIPENEHVKGQLDKSYQPKTKLLNEIQAGESYELVITNFHGGALVRYRTGDMVRITSLKNDKLKINLPQITFDRRVDDLIDLGFIRLTERIIWQAVENTNIPYKDWVAHKEIGETPRLHLYVELKDNHKASEEEIAAAVYEQIQKNGNGLFVYRELASLESLINYKPIRVTLLPQGAFSYYKEQKLAEGAELSQLKPRHINPSDKALSLLLSKEKRKPDTTVIPRTEYIIDR
jgi:hypothetical protein